MKRFLAIILCFALCLSLLPASFAEDIEVVELEDPEAEGIALVEQDPAEDLISLVSGRQGSETDSDEPTVFVPDGYTAIADAMDLWAIRNNMEGNYILTADIDLESALAPGGDIYNVKGWIAPGYASSVDSAVPFTGILDGNGYTIYGLSCSGAACGLIYKNEGTIRNLTLSGGEISNDATSAALVVFNYGTIENCHSSVNVTVTCTATAFLGGIAGHNYNSGTIRNSSNSGTISLNNTKDGEYQAAAGGICGANKGVLDRVWNTGSINVSSRSYWNANSDGGYHSAAGGVVGRIYGSSSLSNTIIVSNAYNTGTVSAKNTYGYHGMSYAGGIIGYIYPQNSLVSKCYNVGSVSATANSESNAKMGGIVGCFSNAGYAIAADQLLSCYFLNTVERGVGNYITNPCVSTSAALMKKQSTFNGFDFSSVWEMGTGDYQYPVIRHAHSLSRVPAVEETCTQDGNIEYWYCRMCGRIFSDEDGAAEISQEDTVVPAGHKFTERIVSPNCVSEGYTVHTCTRCAYEYKDNYIAAYGHSWGEWGINTVPTCTEAGERTRSCTRCEETERQSIDPLGHDYYDTVSAPSCTEQGYTTHTCSRCSDTYKDSFIDPLGHDWGEWETDPGPSCTEPGEKSHSCTRCGETETQAVDALGHNWSEWITVREPGCIESGERSRSCDRCGETETETIEALGHDWCDWNTLVEPTCIEDGCLERSCHRCGEIDMDHIPSLGHDYHETVTDPTCTERGCTTHTCSRCQDSFVDGYVDSLGHDYHVTVTDPTCTDPGYTDHLCSRCGDRYQSDLTDPLGHEYGEPDWSWSADYSAATATFSCTRGDHSEALDAELSMTVGSSQTVVTAKVRFNDKIYLDKKTIRLHISETELSVPVFGSEVLELLFDTGAQTKATWRSSNPSAATVDEDGVVTALKYGKTTITGTAYGISVSCEVQTLFWDVADPGKYYFKHVYWAAENGITKGYDLEYFAPQGECTREQMIMFLWRLADQPEPMTTSSKFPDVKKGSYYYKAVLWGVEKGITNGYSDGPYAGKFGVGVSCTREQAMTFLWRMAGKPNPKTTTNKFSDVKSSDYFYKAVLWASENKIANGYADGTYGVGLACLREHMVTFLSKYDAIFGH